MFFKGWMRYCFVICQTIRNEEEGEWVVAEFKRQLQNFLHLYHRPALGQIFNWFGFTGAFKEGFGQFAVTAVRIRDNRISAESFVVTPRRIIGASFSERAPTPLHKAGIPFEHRVADAKKELGAARDQIEKRYGKNISYNHPSLLLEEARIAGTLADSEGEAVRLLKRIGSRERTPEEFVEQMAIALARVTTFRSKP